MDVIISAAVSLNSSFYCLANCTNYQCVLTTLHTEWNAAANSCKNK